MSRPIVSIVIPTLRSAGTLEACLESITVQDFHSYEIIIVDGGSEDGTLEIARRFTGNVYVQPLGPPAARNFGFTKAEGKIFLSMDSDMSLSSGLLREIAELRAGMGALILPEIGLKDGFLSRCRSLEKRCYLGDPLFESSRVFTREAFESVGGYDESLHFGEDRDVSSRIGERFPTGRTQAVIYHDERGLSLAAYLKKAFMYGRSIHAYAGRRKKGAAPIFNPLNIVLIRHFGKLIKEPVEGVGLFAIKILEYSAGIAGYLRGFLDRKNPKEKAAGKKNRKDNGG